MRAPCKNCTQHKVTADFNCHTGCAAYILYREERDQMAVDRQREGDLKGYTRKAVSRMSHTPIKDYTKFNNK